LQVERFFGHVAGELSQLTLDVHGLDQFARAADELGFVATFRFADLDQAEHGTGRIAERIPRRRRRVVAVLAEGDLLAALDRPLFALCPCGLVT